MGQFISSEIVTGTYVRARLIVDFTPNADTNTSSVSAYVQMWRTNTGYATNGSGTLHIGIDGYGWWSSNITSSQKITYNSYTQVGSTRSLTITHDSTGRWTGNFYVYTSTNVDNITFSQQTFSVTLSPNPVYQLSISTNTGSSVVVNRTYCAGAGGTGNLSAGNKKLYYGDTLKITSTPSANYNITTHTVNGSAVNSGNTWTVNDNVSVVVRATPLKSVVGATDANIGSNSTITVTKYNDNYNHTLQYSFGSLSGYITSSGDTSSSESKFTNPSVSFKVPDTFYAQIPNDPSGTCTITCTTYNGDTSLGSNICTFTATANKDSCSPIVTGNVEADDSFTEALTGSKTTLIKNKSTVLCTLTAIPRNSATISGVKIRGSSVTGETDIDGVVTATKTYSNVSETSFDFYAIDSRDYDTTIPINPTFINYITLTCNPDIYRDTPTGNTISMDVSGNFYRGSFGVYSNTLTLKYRYKPVGGLYPSIAQTLEDGSETDANGWITISDSLITKGTSSYHSTNKLALLSYPKTNESGNTVYDGFDYHIDYEFQVKVYDGASTYVLSTVTKTVNVPRGIPIYDWGENDFNFNVPVMLNNVNILNIMYPVGAVYMHSSSTIPTVLNSVGTWSSVTTGISGVYAWKRTA